MTGTMYDQAARDMRQNRLEQRRQLCEAAVTLDGRPAKISGAHNEYATVTALPDGPSYEWRWAAAAYIVAKDGAFRS